MYLYEDDALQKWACTRTVYDNAGNKLETQTGMTQSATDYTAVRYTYNRFGNVLSITDAQGQAEAYTYDATGRLLTKTDRNGSVTRFTHDAEGRLLKEEVTATDERGSVTSTRECTYTRTGQKKTDTAKETENGVAGLALTTQYRYNERGQLANQQDPGGVEKQLTWDVRGNRESLVLLKSGAVQISLFYQYDEAGRLLRVRQSSASGAILAEYAYDANGNRTRLTSPATGMETTYAYNKANLVTSLTNKQGAQTLSSFAYTYCLDGNQATKTGTEGSVSYTYDRLGRLVTEDDSKWNRIQYTYDRFHNRQKMAVTPNGQQLDKPYTTEYQYDKNNRLTTEVKTGEEGIETTHYRYDKNGSQLYKEWEGLSPDGKNLPKSRVSFIKENKADGTAILDMRQYNGFGQLIRVWRDALDIRYRYRPDKLRHQKTVKSPFTNTKTETLYHWDGQNMVMETNAATGSVKARYLRGANLIAQQIDSQVYYYTHNAHGDVVQRINQAGGATPKYAYDAFGNQREPGANDPNPFRYCGEYWDADLGEVYLRARTYNPANGRFTASDPARDGANWYAYCAGNPIAKIDPSGLKQYEAFYNGKWATVPAQYLGDFETWRIVEEKGTYNYNKGSGGTYTASSSNLSTSSSASSGGVSPSGAKAALNSILDTQYSQFAPPKLNSNAPSNFGMGYAGLTAGAADSRMNSAFSMIEQYRQTIIDAGRRYGIPPEMIAAIILKEQYTQSVPDGAVLLANMLVGRTCSTGLGAIQADTARTAWDAIAPNDGLLHPSNRILQIGLTTNNEFNINSIAVVLSYEAQQAGLNPQNPTAAAEILAHYNGGENIGSNATRYGEYTSQYMPYVGALLY